MEQPRPVLVFLELIRTNVNEAPGGRLRPGSWGREAGIGLLSKAVHEPTASGFNGIRISSDSLSHSVLSKWLVRHEEN